LEEAKDIKLATRAGGRLVESEDDALQLLAPHIPRILEIRTSADPENNDDRYLGWFATHVLEHLWDFGASELVGDRLGLDIIGMREEFR
jgi:hypothetical protein